MLQNRNKSAEIVIFVELSEHIAADFISVIIDKLSRSRCPFVLSNRRGVEFQQFLDVIGVPPCIVDCRLYGADYVVVAVFLILGYVLENCFGAAFIIDYKQMYSFFYVFPSF